MNFAGKEYIFECAGEDDVEAIFSLYEKRVRWMDEKGIYQWNATDYLSAYPISYYYDCQKNGELYALKSAEDGTVVGAAVIFDEDERWGDNASAFYIHNLVTDIQKKGIGKCLITEIEKLALCSDKRFVRLDCAEDNEFLNGYYASSGYKEAGRCEDGPYKGIQREKKL